MNEASVMPSYEHLLSTPIDFEKITDRVWAAHVLGADYDAELTQAPEIAKKQAEAVAADIVSQGGPIKRGELMTFDTQAVALIAYLQRLGTDIFAKPPAVSPDDMDGPAPGEIPEDLPEIPEETASSGGADSATPAS